eukprot:2297387-Amphidinium_carterae.1
METNLSGKWIDLLSFLVQVFSTAQAMHIPCTLFSAHNGDVQETLLRHLGAIAWVATRRTHLLFCSTCDLQSKLQPTWEAQMQVPRHVSNRMWTSIVCSLRPCTLVAEGSKGAGAETA